MPHFARRLKRLVKKYVSLRTELADLEKELEESPRQGKDLGQAIQNPTGEQK